MDHAKSVTTIHRPDGDTTGADFITIGTEFGVVKVVINSEGITVFHDEEVVYEF